MILRKRSWRLAFRRRAAARKGTTQGRIETYSLPPNYVLVGSQDVQTIIGWTILKVSETDTSSPPLSNNMSDVVSGQERRSFSVCWHARSRTFLTCWQISTGRGGAGNTRPSPSRILDPSNVPKCERGHEISLRCVRQASLHAHHTWMMMTRSPTLAARRCREHPMPNTRSRRCRLRGPRRSASGRVCWRNDGSTEPLVLVRTGWSGEQQQKQEQEQGKAKNSEHVTNPGTHVGQAQGHDRSIWVITSDSRDEDSVDLQKVSGMSSDDAQQGELSQ